MSTMTIYLTLVLNLLGNTYTNIRNQDNTLSSLSVYKNCIFCLPTYIYNTCNIKGLKSNAGASINTINNSKEIIINPFDINNYDFIIKNLPIAQNQNNTIFVAIDNKNKLFLEIDSNNKAPFHFSKSDKNIQEEETLNTINIETKTINEFDTSLIINSINNNNENLNILLGNIYNNLIIKSNTILNINTMIFNNTINYPINVTNTVNVAKNITAENITTKKLITNENVTVSFNNTIIDSLNNTSNSLATIQGDIIFNGPVAFGNAINTNLIINANDQNTHFPIYYLGIDNNQNIFATTIPPILKTLNTNKISGAPDLNIFNINPTLTIGNKNANIIFDINTLLIENNFTSEGNASLFFNSKNFFNTQVTFNTVEYMYYLLANQTIEIDAPTITLNQINFNNAIFFPNLKILNDFNAYIGVNIEEDISYLVTIPIETIEDTLKELENQFYIDNKEFLIEIENNKNKIGSKIKNFTTYLEDYKYQLTTYFKLQKQILYYLQLIKEKKININTVENQKILHEIQKDYI